MNNRIDETNPQETPEPRAKRTGRKSFTPNPDQQSLVSTMASFGIPQANIAEHLGIARNTLRKWFRKELKHAAYDANNAVLNSLFKMATTRHNVAAAIFWAKTRCGYRPGAAPYDTAPGVTSTGGPKQSKTTAEQEPGEKVSSLKNLTVYNNEGEPNADY